MGKFEREGYRPFSRLEEFNLPLYLYMYTSKIAWRSRDVTNVLLYKIGTLGQLKKPSRAVMNKYSSSDITPIVSHAPTHKRGS